MKLTEKDKHNLLDLIYMVVDDKAFDVIKLNNMHEWFNDFYDRLEKHCIPELHRNEKSQKAGDEK